MNATDKLIYWLRKEMVFHLEFYGYRPYVRIGWVWVIIAFFFFHWFSYILCGVVTVISIYNFINRK